MYGDEDDDGEIEGESDEEGEFEMGDNDFSDLYDASDAPRRKS